MYNFLITPFQEGPGLRYYYVNWPMFDPVSKRSVRGRKKFTTRGAAEEFLARARVEFRRNAEVILAHDRGAQLDFLRAMDVLRGLQPGATLEKAALLLGRCQAAIERRDGTFSAPEPRSRMIELGPREWLAVRREACRNGWTETDVVAMIIHRWLLSEVEADVSKRARDEAVELAELAARNKRAEALLAGWRHEGQQAAREAGRADGIAEMRARQAKRSRESYHRCKQKIYEQRRVEAVKRQVDDVMRLMERVKASADADVR